ncbi:MAG: tetratricopeptide repeat-containing sensor histidine kinase [Bacteroidales bacterium]|nr:tetratricopeptide repeat-containing sensor histidine kinase [Bacteroidales bacterium]
MQKIKLYISAVLMLISLYSFSQGNRQAIDSLFIELEKADDKAKIEILNNISRNYWNFSLDSSLYFANEALNLAHIVQDKKGISDAYNRIGNVYSLQNESELAFEFFRKCLEIRLEINDSEGLTDIYHNIASEYISKNDYQQANKHFDKALEESIKRNDKEDIAMYFRRIAQTYASMSKYKEAIENYIKALGIAREIKDELDLATIYNGLGNVYFEISSYDEALKYFLDALKIFQKAGNTTGISMMYNNLGIVYQSIDENDKALSYYQKTLEMDIESDNKEGQATAYNNIGTAYDEKGDKEKALEYYNKSLELNKELESKDGIATALTNIGLIYLDLGDYDKADTNLQESTDLTREANDIYSLANNHNNLANLFLRQKQYVKTQNNLNIAIKLSKQINTKEWLLESYDLYYQLYSELNNYKKALEYYKLYSETKDSVFSTKGYNRITEMKIKYETDNLETENKLLKKDNQIHLLELNRQKNIKNYSIAFSILILALALLSFSQFRLKKRTNGLLKSKNDQLKDANKKLTVSEYNLKELNATKDKFFSIIAHDLKNPFQSLLGFSEILYNQMDKLSKDEISEYTKLIYESSQNLFNLLGNLLQWSQSQLGSMKLSPKPINVYDSIDDVLSIFGIAAQKKNIKVESSIAKDATVFADKHVVSTVLRNLISNAIKFTNQGGEIKISSVISNNKIIVSVEDNGKGISEENLEKLFRIDQGYSTKGTENESGTGLGLILCRDLISQSNGELFVESTLGKGSNFKFTLPIIEEQTE